MGTLNSRCRIISRTQKGTLILTTTHLVLVRGTGCREPRRELQGSCTVTCRAVCTLPRGFIDTTIMELGPQSDNTDDLSGPNSILVCICMYIYIYTYHIYIYIWTVCLLGVEARRSYRNPVTYGPPPRSSKIPELV